MAIPTRLQDSGFLHIFPTSTFRMCHDQIKKDPIAITLKSARIIDERSQNREKIKTIKLISNLEKNMCAM
jgi:hypothetical protein